MLGHWWLDIDDLDDAQRTAITLPFDADHLITGPPGSGKTNLLVLRATNLIRNTVPNVLMLVFNRTLEEFISSCPTPYSLSRENISTVQRWEMKLIQQLGGTPKTSGKFPEMRAANCAILTDIVTRQHLHNIIDVALLDEVQDLSKAEVNLILRLAKRVFAVGDERQRIYDQIPGLPALKDRCELHQLEHHYRNGKKICELADEIGRQWDDYIPLVGSMQYNDDERPSKVTTIKCANIAETAQKLIVDVSLQLKAYPDEMIGILCPRHQELRDLYEAIRGSELGPMLLYQNSEDGYLPFGDGRRVCLCTVHSAKGLEFRATNLVGSEYLKKFGENQRRLTYTAITRAKTILNIYHCGTLPSYLRGAIAAVTPKTAPVALEQLFKK